MLLMDISGRRLWAFHSVLSTYVPGFSVEEEELSGKNMSQTRLRVSVSPFSFPFSLLPGSC